MKTPPPGAGASLICGILSIVLSWLPIAGLVLGIVGIVKANKARRLAAGSPEVYAGGGTAVGGLICGVIGVVFSTLWTCLFFISMISALLWFTTARPMAQPILREHVAAPAYRGTLLADQEAARLPVAGAPSIVRK